MNENKAFQALDGLMLGDGGLERHGRGARFYMRQSKATISISDHLKWEMWLSSNVFRTLGIPVGEVYPKVSTSLLKGEPYQYAKLTTHTSLLLAAIHDEWYTKERWDRGKAKKLPWHLLQSEVLPIPTLVHWFLGDGGSSFDRRPGQYETVYVRFSTHCFAEEEVYHLMYMLDCMNIATTNPKQCKAERGSGLMIVLAQESVDRFMDLIEPPILEIFADSMGPSYKDLIKRKRVR